MRAVLSEALLPEIKIVRHARARNLRLRVEPSGIRLTVPLFASTRQIQQFLNQSEQWLIETWNNQQNKFSQTVAVPEDLKLFHHVEAFKLIQQKQRQIFKFDFEQHCLFVRNKQFEKALQAAVIAYAKHFLPEYLKQISLSIGLPYQKCSIRKPKTRWGSCSAKHDIMLNAALVLMPEHIVRSVCIHELAHTIHFDHSAAFWNKVAQYDENYLENRKQLKNIQLPAWWYV